MNSNGSTKFWQALLAARAEMPVIQKRGVNPRFGSKYALLDDIIGAVVPVLGRHGLMLTQPVEQTENGTILVHTDVVLAEDGSRERLCSVPLTLAERRDAQAVAALITYGRRIGLGAGVALALEDDDDANAASPAPAPAPAPTSASTPTATPAQPTGTPAAQTKATPQPAKPMRLGVEPSMITGVWPAPSATASPQTQDASVTKPTEDWRVPAGKANGGGRVKMSSCSPEHLERFAEWMDKRLAMGDGNPTYRDQDMKQIALARQWAAWLRAHPEDRKDTRPAGQPATPSQAQPQAQPAAPIRNPVEDMAQAWKTQTAQPPAQPPAQPVAQVRSPVEDVVQAWKAKTAQFQAQPAPQVGYSPDDILKVLQAKRTPPRAQDDLPPPLPDDMPF